MLLQESLGAVLPISLVMYGLGVFGALLGMAVATLTAGLVGVLVSVLFMLKMRGSSNEALGFWVNLKKILRYGVPLAVSSLVVTAVGQIYSFMLAAYVFEYEIGNYNAADKLISPISYLAFPIVTVLFPAFAKINPKKDAAVLKKFFKYSVKYSSFLIMPAILLMVLLARPLTVVLFGVEFENAWIYFALLAVFKLDYGLGNDHITRLLMAQGETTFIAKIEAFSALIGVGLALILIPSYGVLGLILIRSITSWPYYVIVARKAYKSYGVIPPFRDIGKLYVSLAITALAVLPVTVAPINDALKVAIGSAVGLIILVVALPITGAIKERDTNTLTELIRPQPFIGKIADKILRIMGRIANFT
jgi:O-antigen/teichoic acid export membrane protein